ncbi:hypothetical protein Hanom_Chr16g01476131 [Helianthus anomalus]
MKLLDQLNSKLTLKSTNTILVNKNKGSDSNFFANISSFLKGYVKFLHPVRWFYISTS